MVASTGSKTSTATSAGGFVVVEIAKGVKYHLHRAWLVEYSDYFRTPFKGPWKEAEDAVVRLENVESGWRL